ncbi:MAG: agmatinase, partial [Microcoleaceae cyanobacterium]
MSAIANVDNCLLPFIGSEIEPDYDAAKVVILPIPYEATTTYRRGCANGPGAVLEASQQLECYDEELDRETALEVGIATWSAIADTRNGTIKDTEMLAVTKKTVGQLIKDGKFVISIGGEHSITFPIVDAYQEAEAEPFTVIQIDAHGDLRHEYEGSIYNHACVMRRIVDLGLPTLQIGIRAICKEEANLIKAKQLPVFFAREIVSQPDWINNALAQIKTKKVFITIDLDGIDPTLIPGVGTPEPGGLN